MDSTREAVNVKRRNYGTVAKHNVGLLAKRKVLKVVGERKSELATLWIRGRKRERGKTVDEVAVVGAAGEEGTGQENVVWSQ